VGHADLLSGTFSLAALACYLAANSTAAPSSSSLPPSWYSSPYLLNGFAFGLAVLSSFSKEVGVTTFALFVAHEIIEALVTEKVAGSSSSDISNSGGSSSGSSSGGQQAKSLLRRCLGPFEPLLDVLASTAQRLTPKVPSKARSTSSSSSKNSTATSTAPARTAAVFGATSCVVGFHLSLHGSTTIMAWTVLENDVSLLSSRLGRTLSYAHIHARYAGKLLWPWWPGLCYDHGHECVPKVLSLHDPRICWAACLYGLLLVFGLQALAEKDRPSLWGMSLLVGPFLPASHVMFPVGTILGERLLYVPSAGYCLLVALAVGPALANTANQLKTTAVAAVGFVKPFLGLGAGDADVVDRVQGKSSSQKKRSGRRQMQSTGAESSFSTSSLPPSSPSSSLSLPLSSQSKKQPQQQRQQQQQQQQQQQRGRGRSPFFSSRWGSLMASAALLTYSWQLASYTVSRNSDWASEAALFESAMEVCPKSLKVLNNLALVVLEGSGGGGSKNDGGAVGARAGGAVALGGPRRSAALLDEALSIHPTFVSALFNRGLAHHHAGEHADAANLFQRTVDEDPSYHKARACLARAHFHLGFSLVDASYLAPPSSSGKGQQGLPPSAEVLRREAQALFRSSVSLVERCLANGYGAPIVWWVRGLASAELGDHSSAAASYERCLDSNDAMRGGGSGGGGGGFAVDPYVAVPDTLDGQAQQGVLNGLGVSLRALGDHAKAMDAFERAIALIPYCLAPEERTRRTHRGTQQRHGGGGTVHAEGSGGGEGCGHEALANAAGLLADQGDTQRALAYYQEALAQNPSSAEVVNNLGFLHERLDDLAEAARHYRHALNLLGYPARRNAQIETNLRLVEARIPPSLGGALR
jgi:tetratricopeptide (TPR) repeat protein